MLSALLLTLLASPATARAQDEQAPPSPRPVTIIVVPTAAPTPARALVLAPPVAETAAPPRARTPVGARVATLGAGVGLLAGGWVVTFVGTIAWYFDTTDCRGAGISLLGPDPDGPYHCDHRGPNDDALGASFLPLVGPWVMLNTPNVDPAFPVTMGVLQAAGFLTLVIGVPLAWSDPQGRGVALDVRGEPGGATLSARGRF